MVAFYGGFFKVRFDHDILDFKGMMTVLATLVTLCWIMLCNAFAHGSMSSISCSFSISLTVWKHALMCMNYNKDTSSTLFFSWDIQFKITLFVEQFRRENMFSRCISV